ncbi:uncharacterized protein LOC135161337 isoform X1 [Diachasmimorpha longicaudata]|uniref:uncharacterized protein LOC135161337 isoform X1 n=1 Tax=Diachasmimorpha longicaudata TaxID=58733 RepID=UPI0030B8F520
MFSMLLFVEWLESQTLYQCRACSYESERRFNVQRHERRIHDKTITRVCCGLKMTTKGDWYNHCASSHPKKRPTGILTPPKYKIHGHTHRSSCKIIRSEFIETSSDWSQSSTIFQLSPVVRRHSTRISQQTLQKIQQQLESSDDEDDSIEVSEKLDTMYSGNELPEQNKSHVHEIPYLESQLNISDPLELDALIRQVPLNTVEEPEENFLQSLENPENVAGDFIFNQGIDGVGNITEEFRDNHMAVVLQEVNENVIYNDYYVSSSVSSMSLFLSNGGHSQETDSNSNHILGGDKENQLPPKKMILKKFLGGTKMNKSEDKENAPPGCREFVNETVNMEVRGERQVYFPWNELTQMQRHFLDSIDFERYKL